MDSKIEVAAAALRAARVEQADAAAVERATSTALLAATRAADEASLALEFADVEESPALDERLKHATARAAAATRQDERARAGVLDADARVTAARAALNAAAGAILDDRIRCNFQDFLDLAHDFREAQRQLFAAYLARPGALEPAQWLELDASRAALAADALLIGLPLVGVSMLDPTGGMPDRQADRRAIDELTPCWADAAQALAAEAVDEPAAVEAV